MARTSLEPDAGFADVKEEDMVDLFSGRILKVANPQVDFVTGLAVQTISFPPHTRVI